MAMMEAGLMRRGIGAAAAHAGALRAMAGMVARQAEVVAFDKAFQLGGLMMLTLLPLVFFLRQPAQPFSAAAHVEVEAG
jgi:hypothetical protein